MTELEALFVDEARRIDPLYQKYLASPSAATGAAYDQEAEAWLARAQKALATQSKLDSYYIPVSNRWATVGKNVLRISAAGHAAGVKQRPFFDRLKDELGLTQAADDAGRAIPVVLVGLGLVAIVAVVVALRK